MNRFDDLPANPYWFLEDNDNKIQTSDRNHRRSSLKSMKEMEDEFKQKTKLLKDKRALFDRQ